MVKPVSLVCDAGKAANLKPQSPVQSSCRATPPTTPPLTHHASGLHSFGESPRVGLAPEACALEALTAQVSNEAKGVRVAADTDKGHTTHRALPQWLLLCISLCLPTPGLVTRGLSTVDPLSSFQEQAMIPSTPVHPSTAPNFTFWYLNGMCSHERVRHTEHGRDPGILVPSGGEDTNGLVQHIHSWGDIPTMVSPRHKKAGIYRVCLGPSHCLGIQRDENTWGWA